MPYRFFAQIAIPTAFNHRGAYSIGFSACWAAIPTGVTFATPGFTLPMFDPLEFA